MGTVGGWAIFGKPGQGRHHASPACGECGSWRSGIWVKLLVIGGTRFVGRAFVELAVRHGHDVAVFHRSVSEPEGLPSVEHLHGDRDGQLGLLRGRSWDAVLDTCAYVPRAVREASAVLRDAAGHYTLVSTLSVHPDDMPAGATEEAATFQPPFPQTEADLGARRTTPTFHWSFTQALCPTARMYQSTL